ncbi:MAG TPA: hypothetical protein VFQ43_05290, partial [Nitrososphaera sp.]|nr:hypothetical protein [Nitrososphaera sp.]
SNVHMQPSTGAAGWLSSLTERQIKGLSASNYQARSRQMTSGSTRQNGTVSQAESANRSTSHL